MATRKMDAPEMASRLNITIRHARRLRASDDERCYTDSFSVAERPTPSKPDMLETLRDGSKKIGEEYMFCGVWRAVMCPDDYSNRPANFEDIEAAMRKYNRAKNALDDAIGLYEWDDPDGSENNGLPTVYQRHELGLPIHIATKPLVEKWAKKYGKVLKPELFFKDE